MKEKVASLREQFKSELKNVRDLKDVEALKIRYLGKKGPIQDLMSALRDCSVEERPHFGKQINDLKEELSQLCDQALQSFSEAELASRVAEEKIDVTLPGRRRFLGRKHPLTLALDEILDIFAGMGFTVQVGPDIDSDYYNFEGLNYPPDHPAREMQDTFYISSTHLLRSHTSNTQLRVMETNKPPLRIVTPGTVYRNEDISSRSHVFFHQVEGLYIDKGVTFSDLFVTLQEFLNKLFHKKVETRFRPSFFPFVEPGLEVDIRCTNCNGSGCRLCKESGWLEFTGAGMVHPEVLKNGGIDPEIYSGFAWGMGVERLTMLRYGINDIRLFSENDLRFLTQF